MVRPTIAQAVRLPSKAEHFNVVQKAIENGGCRWDVPKQLSPILQWSIGCHDRTASFVSAHYDFEQELAATFGQLLHSKIVNNQQVGLQVPIHYTVVTVHGFIMKEVTNYIEDASVIDLISRLDQLAIPPDADGEFVACMEEVLDTYEEPYNPEIPVICMDEQPVQLHKEIRTPIPATAKHPQRVDYEYERCGTACVFMFTEPLAGWRQVSVRDRRTKIDWALEMESLLNGRYKDADKVILICDNLNTHTKGAFYEVFKPEKARSLVERIEFRYTPKHGSWLNAAENELSSMTRQCVAGRRIPAITKLRSETKAWSQRSNKKQKGVDWQFQIDDARLKLNSLYPKIKT